MKESCFHGLKFADPDSPFSHKFFAMGYGTEQRQTIEALASANIEAYKRAQTEALFNHERESSMLSSHRRFGKYYLYKNGILPTHEKNMSLIMSLLKRDFGYLPIFKDKFELDDEVEPMRGIHFEFEIENASELPNTENIIFQILIVGEPSYNGEGLRDENLEKYVKETCKSAEKFGLGMITLYSSDKELSVCSGWKNSITVKFKSKLRKFYAIEDERLFALEQFTRQFKLWNKYKFVYFFFFFLSFFHSFFHLLFLSFFLFIFFSYFDPFGNEKEDDDC